MRALEPSSGAYNAHGSRLTDILPASDFKTAFREIAVHLGHSGSDIILFSDVPFDPEAPSVEEIERLAERAGLEILESGDARILNRNFDLPALVIFNDGTALALLECDPKGRYATDAAATEALKVDLKGANTRDVWWVMSFGSVSADTIDSAINGKPAGMMRRHWLVSALRPFWKSYLQVALAALFINLLALVTPLFTMNVYDRILPNEAMATLWVLVLGVTTALSFDLLLKSIRAALIE
jgi:ATP-binding cassette subfamily C protein LapB